jgi:hypothetical protein
MFTVKSTLDNNIDFWIYESEYDLYIRENGTLGGCHPKFFKTRQEAQDFLNKWLPKRHWVFNFPPLTGQYGKTFYRIDWLTPEYVQEQAKLGDKEALDCSIEHWKQVVVAGYDEFIKAQKANRVDIDSFYCALCCRNHLITHLGCSDACLIYRKLKSGCSNGTPFRKVTTALAKEDKQAFESAAVEELNFLIELRNELFGNPYLETKEMSTIDERIAQCKKDREAIDRNLKELEEQKEKEKKHQFEPGDVAITRFWQLGPRIILKIRDGEICSFSNLGLYMNHSQREFESNGYEYVGKISDFINKDTVAKFQRDGKVI